MTDHDDKFDEFLTRAAAEYHEPPPVPRDAIWARIEQARRDPRGRTVELRPRARPMPWIWLGAAIAAGLTLGVAIGRLTGKPSAPMVAGLDSVAIRRGETVMRFAAVDHLSRIEALLTDYDTGQMDDQFRTNARELLATTRLMLDSRRLRDPRIRSLLSDLEVLLVQVSHVTADAPTDERTLIDQNMAERKIRIRVRNAIPAGPTA
jgi:hypothetical protein